MQWDRDIGSVNKCVTFFLMNGSIPLGGDTILAIDITTFEMWLGTL